MRPTGWRFFISSCVSIWCALWGIWAFFCFVGAFFRILAGPLPASLWAATAPALAGGWGLLAIWLVSRWCERWIKQPPETARGFEVLPPR